MEREWMVEHFTEANGSDPIADFLKELRKGAGPKAVARVERQIDVLGDLGFHAPDDVVRKVGGDLWELRTQFQRNPYRILFYNPSERTLVLLHAFHKKDRAIPEGDILKAERRMADDRKRRA
jgi:phage-related protein